MADDQGGPADVLDDVGHGEGFARAGDAHEGLEFLVVGDILGEGGDGRGLIAGGAKITDYFKLCGCGHLLSLSKAVIILQFGVGGNGWLLHLICLYRFGELVAFSY